MILSFHPRIRMASISFESILDTWVTVFALSIVVRLNDSSDIAPRHMTVNTANEIIVSTKVNPRPFFLAQVRFFLNSFTVII